MNLSLQSTLDFGLAKSADILNQGFSGYFVPVHFSLADLHNYIRANHIDVLLSKVVFLDHKPVGVGFIAHRGWSSRVAAMCIIPEARGKKVGQWLIAQLIEQAKARHDRSIELEVIQENTNAFRLYQKMGFRTIRKLASYHLEAPEGAVGDLEEIDLRAMANLVNTNGYPMLPWQISGENLAAGGPPSRCFHLDSSYAAISNPDADRIVVHSLLTLPHVREQGRASRLLKALFAEFPGKTWAIPGYYPEEMDGFLKKVGFQIEALGQYQMVLNLD